MDEKRLHFERFFNKYDEKLIALREELGVYYVITVYPDDSQTSKTLYGTYKVTESQDGLVLASPIAVNVDYDTALRTYLQGGGYHA